MSNAPGSGRLANFLNGINPYSAFYSYLALIIGLFVPLIVGSVVMNVSTENASEELRHLFMVFLLTGAVLAGLGQFLDGMLDGSNPADWIGRTLKSLGILGWSVAIFSTALFAAEDMSEAALKAGNAPDGQFGIGLIIIPAMSILGLSIFFGSVAAFARFGIQSLKDDVERKKRYWLLAIAGLVTAILFALVVLL